jgi:hypothetical protein
VRGGGARLAARPTRQVGKIETWFVAKRHLWPGLASRAPVGAGGDDERRGKGLLAVQGGEGMRTAAHD